MKVCTDACLFGAWVANKLKQKEITPNKIMDIGCGTGLLSLMLAQNTTVQIDAIEINAAAFLQATENIEASPFKNQVHTFHGPVEQFAAHEKYDFIICNPPFYENQLQSTKADRNAAMHETTLSFDELANALFNILSINGKAAILLPYDRVLAFEKILHAKSFFIEEQLNVQHTSTHPFFRSFLLISNQNTLPRTSTLAIKNSTGDYTAEFCTLLKDYYLNL
jgi:tRNA1Val (adenine37-N6)-methyltransferase